MNGTILAADCISMIQADVRVKHATVAATLQRHVKSLTLEQIPEPAPKVFQLHLQQLGK